MKINGTNPQVTHFCQKEALGPNQGMQQRDFISKEDASSPKLSTESVLLTSLVDAQENCDVAIVDIPNAFIQTMIEDKEDKVIMRIQGHMVDVLVKVAPKV